MKARGLQVIEVVFSDTDTPEIVKKFVETYKPNFPVGIIDGAFFVKWSGVTPEMRPTVPMVYIIDRKGVIQAQFMGADPMMEEKYQDLNLRAKVMQYMGSPGTAGAKPAANSPAGTKRKTNREGRPIEAVRP